MYVGSSVKAISSLPNIQYLPALANTYILTTVHNLRRYHHFSLHDSLT